MDLRNRRILFLAGLNLFLLGLILPARDHGQPVTGGFMPNAGQVTDLAGHPAEQVLYYQENPGSAVFLTAKGLTFAFYQVSGDSTGEVAWLNLQLDGGNIRPEAMEMRGESAAHYDFYLPQIPDGRRHLRKYQELLLREVYPGIDWRLYSLEDGGIKYDFILHPGADPAAIRLVYEGENVPVLEADGSLGMKHRLGNLQEMPPKSFQMEGRREVESRFRLKQLDGNRAVLQIETGAYDRGETLVIDPLIRWSTFFGGSLGQNIYSMDTDTAGNLFVTGITSSSDFPVMSSGTYSGSFQNGGDIFISKFDPDGQLLWSTFYGGNDAENGHSLKVDPAGNIFISAETFSTNLPTQNAGSYFDGVFNGFRDIFLLKFDNAGNRLWATYFGGNDAFDEYAYTIDLDAAGNLFLGGYTDAADFPTMNAGTYFDGSISVMDMVVAKFDNAGNLLWSTFLGGSSQEFGTGIAVGPNGHAFVCGGSISGDFPTLSAGGYFDGTLGGQVDAVIVEFDNLGNLVWSSFFGGSASAPPNVLEDMAASVIVDDFGSVFLTGNTYTTDFPLQNAGTYFDPSYNGMLTANGVFGGDMFLSKFDSGRNLVWSTYFGGSEIESLLDGGHLENTSLDSCGNLYFSFGTYSNDIPTLDPGCGSFFMGSYSGVGSSGPWGSFAGGDIALCRFSNTGELQWSTYLGFDNTGIRSSIGMATFGNDLYLGGHNFAFGNPVGIPLVNPGSPAYFDSSTASNGDKAVIFHFRPDTLQAQFVTTPDTCGCSGAVTAMPCGNPPFAYHWSSGDSVATASGLCAGSYMLTITDASCPVRKGIFTVAVPGGSGTLSIQASQTNPSCGSPGSATVSPAGGTPPYTYTWSTGDSTSTASGLAAGNYSCTITDFLGCFMVQSFNLVDLGGQLSFNLQVQDASCENSTDGSISVTGLVSNPPYTFSWSNGGSASTLNGLSPGTYSVTISDSTGCTGSDTAQVGFNPLPTLTAGPDLVVCNADSVQLTASGTGLFLWSPPLGLDNPSDPGPHALPPATTWYTVTLTDSNGCQSSDSVLVTVSQVVMSGGPSQSLCEGSTVQLSASGAMSYQWTPPSFLSNPGIANPLAQPAGSLQYLVAMTDQYGCQDTDTVALTVVPSPAPHLGPDSLHCDVGMALLESGAAGSQLWSTGDTTVAILAEGSGLYWVQVTANGCSARDSVVIGFKETPLVVLGGDTTVCTNDHFRVKIPLLSDPGAGLLWSTGVAGPELEVKESGWYGIMAQNECGKSEDSIFVELLPHAGPFVPNAFTPNGDGLNDVFTVVAPSSEAYRLEIFDRWGKLLFETEDPGKSWDGGMDGQPVQEGAYAFRLRSVDCKGAVKVRRGTVTVIR